MQPATLISKSFASALRIMPQPAPSPMADTILPRFRMTEGSFLALADAIQGEKYGFQPEGG